MYIIMAKVCCTNVFDPLYIGKRNLFIYLLCFLMIYDQYLSATCTIKGGLKLMQLSTFHG